MGKFKEFLTNEGQYVSLSKKDNYDVTSDGKLGTDIQISLRFKGKLIVTGTKVSGMFIMAFEPNDGSNKLPKSAKVIKKDKMIHIAFKNVDDIIDYAKSGNIVS